MTRYVADQERENGRENEERWMWWMKREVDVGRITK